MAFISNPHTDPVSQSYTTMSPNRMWKHEVNQHNVLCMREKLALNDRYNSNCGRVGTLTQDLAQLSLVGVGYSHSVLPKEYNNLHTKHRSTAEVTCLSRCSYQSRVRDQSYQGGQSSGQLIQVSRALPFFREEVIPSFCQKRFVKERYERGRNIY